MATKLGMFSATHVSVIVPVGRDRKIRTELKANQIAGIVTVPLLEKILVFYLKKEKKIRWR